MPRFFRALALRAWPMIVVTSLLSAGCATSHYGDPVPQMLNRERDPEERLAAAKQAQAERPDDPARIEALHHLVWDRGHPESLRRYAIDQLIAHDEQAFKATAMNRVVLVENADVLRYLFDQAVERKWADFTPAVVRSWARRINGVRDEDRVEYGAIKRLNPGREPAEIVYGVFSDPALPADQRGAAWELLNRLSDRATVTRLLGDTTIASPMVADLKRGLAELGVLPTNREGLTWLMHLADPSRRPLWDRMKAVVAALPREKRAGLELRHLEPLLVAGDARLAMDRAALSRRVSTRVAPRQHALLSPTFDGQAKDYPQQLYEWEPKLTWADLLVLDVLLDAIENANVRKTLFEQADADQRDTTTEFGGLLAQTGTAAEYRAFPTRTRRHDRIYLAPPELIEAVYTGLAHVHFHAQEHRNSQFAGPGRGDQEFAERLNFNNLVFTFIDRDNLNVDYYHHGGVVIDLGMVRRP